MNTTTTTTTATKKRNLKKEALEGSFSIKINIGKSFPLNFEDLSSDECEECIEEYDGQILHDDEEVVGKFKFGILNAIRSINSGFSSASTFDVGGEPFEYYQVIYKYGTYEFNDFLEAAIGDEGYGNAAYISSVEILPQYRGFGLGKKVLKSILNYLNGKVEVVVLKSFPIQFSSSVEHMDDEPDNSPEKEWYNKMCYYDSVKNQPNQHKAQIKLNKYYTSCGFSKIKLPKDWMDSDESFFGLNLNLRNDSL